MIWKLVLVWYTLINDLIARRMKKKIHQFGIDGSIGDEANIPQVREMFERQIIIDMRDRGYVPIYDINTQFSTSYDARLNQFDFYIVVYGVYVGKRKAKTIDGFSGQTFYNKA
jgi:hypothetical protein